MKQYMCIDIGGTEIKYGILDENKLFLTKDKMPTEVFKDGPSLLEKTVGIVRKYPKLWRMDGVRVSTVDMVDVEKGEIFCSTLLTPDYASTKIKARMEPEFGLPCEAENSVNYTELSKTVSGVAAGGRSTLCLTVGTGIEGYIIIDGNVYHGFSDSVREVGHMYMEDSGFQTLGAVSTLASKAAPVKREPVHIWNGLHISELVKAGDSVYIQVIDDMCDVLGRGVSNICYAINLQVVVLRGDVMTQEKYLRPRVQAAMDRYLISSIRERTALIFAQRGDNARIRGAYYHFKERQG